jgi:peptide/nickel transport system substrate-binding protein
MKFRLSTVLAATAAVFAVGFIPAGALAAARPGTSATIPLLNVGNVGIWSTLDPTKTEGCNQGFCTLFQEHLLTFGPNGRLEPQLATSVAQPNPVTYICHLREDVRFWDGDQMTSADVVNSLDYEAAAGSETTPWFVDLKSIRATNQYTVVITLKHPDAAWKYSLAYPGVIFEKKFQEAHPTTMGHPGVLIEETGPWEVDSFDPTTGLELSANPHWWGGKVPIQDISVKFFSDETGMALDMRAGEIDVAFPADGEAFAATSGEKVTPWPYGNNLGYFAMNTRLKPWSDIHVRRAVAYALDRTAIITANGGPTSATAVDTFISAQALGTLGPGAQVNALLNSVPQYPFNLAKAKQEMAESAYPKGFTASTETLNYGGFVDVNEVIANELQQIGIKLKVSVVTDGAWASWIFGPKNYGDVFTTYGATTPDPSGEPSELLGSDNVAPGGLNCADYAPKSVDELLAHGLAASNSATRLAIYGQLLRTIGTDVPYVPLFETSNYVATSTKFTFPAPEGLLFFEFDWGLQIKPSA